MSKTIKLALAQINPIVGDIAGNTAVIIRHIRLAVQKGADVVAFPELAVTGYPPEDLLLKQEFISRNMAALSRIREATRHITAVVGFVDSGGRNPDIYNAAAVMQNRRMLGIYHKIHLPNYGVFDEKRYFSPGKKPMTFRLKNGFTFGVNICEDIWADNGPTRSQSRNSDLIINISASPFNMGKAISRQNLIRKRAQENKVSVAYLNMVGGQDELIFDGRSMIFGLAGNMTARAKSFSEELLISDIPSSVNHLAPIADYLPEFEAYEALKLGVRDYIHKNGFSRAVVGLSGGIDSAMVFAVAVDALGKDNVKGVFMPSRYTSKLSSLCVRKLADSFGVGYLNIPIQQIHNAYLKLLKPYASGAGRCIDITKQNLQARIRGNILMALSNRYNWLVLTTGNKSELSTGYATLYGDMAGGLAVLKDVPKMLVYQLARYRNRLAIKPVIPEEIIKRVPTAELKPNQKDSDTLPSYEILDTILKSYIEDNKDIREIASFTGHSTAIIRKVVGMVDHSEYKRRQSAPGIKITPRAFGKDRRFPIVNKFKT
jgi:NAD+ synthase (glutamine-hydrolysing)